MSDQEGGVIPAEVNEIVVSGRVVIGDELYRKLGKKTLRDIVDARVEAMINKVMSIVPEPVLPAVFFNITRATVKGLDVLSFCVLHFAGPHSESNTLVMRWEDGLDRTMREEINAQYQAVGIGVEEVF